jgi:hypothetical protein
MTWSSCRCFTITLTHLGYGPFVTLLSTPTLLEIQQLTGLPIFGHFYDKFMVSSADLGDFTRFSHSLQRTYEIYYHLRRGHPGVPFRHWIAYFTDRVYTRPAALASTRDPFGTGRLEIHHDGPIPSQDTLCSHDVDRETYLTAFISWWICYFCCLVLQHTPFDLLCSSWRV